MTPYHLNSFTHSNILRSPRTIHDTWPEFMFLVLYLDLHFSLI